MKIRTTELRHRLTEAFRQSLLQVQSYKSFPLSVLDHKENKDLWSVLECIEHLNLYGDYYLPTIRRCIDQSPPSSPSDVQKRLLGPLFCPSDAPE